MLIYKCYNFGDVKTIEAISDLIIVVEKDMIYLLNNSNITETIIIGLVNLSIVIDFIILSINSNNVSIT